MQSPPPSSTKIFYKKNPTKLEPSKKKDSGKPPVWLLGKKNSCPITLNYTYQLFQKKWLTSDCYILGKSFELVTLTDRSFYQFLKNPNSIVTFFNFFFFTSSKNSFMYQSRKAYGTQRVQPHLFYWQTTPMGIILFQR